LTPGALAPQREILSRVRRHDAGEYRPGPQLTAPCGLRISIASVITRACLGRQSARRRPEAPEKLMGLPPAWQLDGIVIEGPRNADARAFQSARLEEARVESRPGGGAQVLVAGSLGSGAALSSAPSRNRGIGNGSGHRSRRVLVGRDGNHAVSG